uniref:Transient receptor potential cation channel subfamily M member 2 n=1 Tax=Esox lucius TaxID=8010 RepID=A0A6Q2WPK8_ESOLU
MLPRCEIKIHPDKIDSRLGSVKVQIRTGLSQLFSDIKKHYLASWIKDNIQKEECCFYVQGDREGVCMCGYLKIHHVDDSIKPESNQAVTWDRHNHVRQVPTDAFGDISFGGLGQKTGKYVRVSSDTKPEVLYQLLTEHWKLPPPNLIISVTGGAKNFYMKPQLKAQFRRGLIKVAQTTGAWIITGGTHTGVMKHTGQAVRDYILSNNSTEGQIVTIGIATWGVIHNRKPLVHPQGRFPAYYSQDVQTQGHMSCLDNNHSHFLLVDDGTNGRYGVEIELRSRLERLISQQPLGNKESGVRIPVVCVVLEGGPGTLNTIYMAMLNGTPCVVLEGSGRLADVIAHVAGFPVAKVTLSLIHQLLKRFFCQEYASFTELMVIEWTKKIQDMIQMSQLLTVFRISEDDHGDVDVAILQALLKANRSSGSEGRESWERQLELAVAWNRVDIAKSDIFTEESQWKSSDLHEAMFSALLGNKHQFVRLFLENGVCLRQFLQEDTTLCHLYTHLPTSCFFLRLLVKRIQTERTAAPLNISLRLVSDEIRHLLGSFTQPLYPLPGLAISYLKEDVSVNVSIICLDCMSAALAASKILKKLAEEDEEEDDEAKEMRELANYYERHAIGVFSECHSCDEDRARRMLIRSSPSWGHTTCLRLALEANDKSFIAHSGVQTLLTQIWCGELAVDNPLWRVLLCMVKFYWNIVFYFGFLLLFSVVLMIDFQTTPSWRECLLYVWIFSLVCEEIRQLFHDPDGFPFNKKAKMYIKDMWNILDVLSILLFIIGLVFRLTTSLFYAGKVILCIDFIIFCLRLMAIFIVSKTLGPKIIIVKRMILDMFFFLFLLSIWVLAFGVAKQGILINNEDRLNWIVRGAVYEPYLIIFGNMPSDIDTTQFDISACTVNGTDPLKPKCPVLNEDQRPAFPEWLTIILLCVYLLFANILLLNLLIAIFNYTFQEVQDNTDNIWKFQRYELIKEYYSRPALPPPFILLSHIYIFIRRLVLRKPLQGHQTFKEELSKEEEEELLSWESFMKDNYLQSTRQQHSQDMDQRQELTHPGHALRFSVQVSQSAEALQWIMDALKSQGFNAIIDAPQLASPGKHCKDESADPKTKEVEKKSYHVNARRLVYPGSNITRFPVPEEKVPWEVPDLNDSYRHFHGPHDFLRKPCFLGTGFNENTFFFFCRTGMRGRGSLCCLGPNHILELVLTRYEASIGSVLEFLSVWNREESLWELPGVSSVGGALAATWGEYRIGDTWDDEQLYVLQVYEGYVDDIRNTDSAWLETTVLNIHLDRTDHQLADINRMVRTQYSHPSYHP